MVDIDKNNMVYIGKNNATTGYRLPLGAQLEVGEILSNFEQDALAFELKGCIIRA
ncbi:MAG: hypothetical protein ACC663_02020 [Gammaproteobacteria bacterium]